MYKKLQIKFIISSILSTLIVVVLLVGIINIVNYTNVVNDLDDLSSYISTIDNQPSEFDNMFKHKPSHDYSQETLYQTRYFTVRIDQNGYAYVNRENIITVQTNEEAIKLASTVLNKKKENGFINSFFYKVLQNKTSIKIVVFIESTQQLDFIDNFLFVSCLVGFIGVLFVGCFASLFSKKVVKPFYENNQRQKQFVTDASHELKTPLSVIMADVDVLKMEYGENEWIESIQGQTKKLTKLVSNLVQLARMDEGKIQMVYEKLDLSSILEEITDVYQKPFENNKVNCIINIQDGLRITADDNAIRQVLSTLFDNALKYTNTGGDFKVDAYQKGKQTVIALYNTCDYIDKNSMNKLFDRFYRGDKSRSQKEGFGIGLSFAKSIIQMNGGSISAVTQDEKSITFTLIFK